MSNQVKKLSGEKKKYVKQSGVFFLCVKKISTFFYQEEKKHFMCKTEGRNTEED